MTENGMGGMGMHMGGAGERSVGRRDVKTEAALPVVQGIIHVAVDVITMLAFLVAALTLGRIATWIMVTVMLFMFLDYATESLGRRVRNPRMLALIYSAEQWLPWAWLLGGLILLRLVMPYEWAFYPATQEHYLVVYRQIDGLTDNRVYNVSLLARALVLILCAAWALAAGLLRRHFQNEINAFYPMKAVSPAEAGVDPRDWQARAPRDNSVTVHLETVRRTNPAHIGRAVVYPGENVQIDDLVATPAQWLALTHIAAVNAKPTEATMCKNNFTQDEWRKFRAQLVQAGLIESLSDSEHPNSGYDFTEEGREFFKAKRWDRRR